MENRWKMNRIGFVNFWFYDNETFELENGKILFRGQNGSGKSITTQSFIPFILDGDRTPSRLDPSGTSDRKMEYYFLGDGDKEESTGYLYLEFKKEESEEYRTIGIGQTAHRGKPMSFWGFVLLNNERIGKDFDLFRKSADKIIPLEKQELKKALPENTPFTDSQKEYKEMVNKYLFGFERIDQYEQLIKLLIKVRAPKLSNNIKPTKVYEILNESLQVLSDDDLRPMVDAMEKMDSIQENLEGLKRSLTDASQIMKEYEHYNKYMLAKKAHNYVDACSESNSLNNDYENEIKKVDGWKEQLQLLTSNLDKLQMEDAAIRNEIEQLTDSTLENLDLRFQNLNKELEDNIEKKETKEKQINQKNEQIHLLEVSIKDLSNKVDYIGKQINDCLKYMDDLQEEIKSDFHDELKKLVREDKDINENLIKSQINTLKKNVQTGKELLIKTKLTESKYLESEKNEEENNKIYISKQNEYEELNKQKEIQQDLLLNSIESLKNNLFWQVSVNTIDAAKNIVESYLETSDSLKLKEILREDYNEKTQKENKNIAILKAEETQIREAIIQKQQEYKNIQEQKIIEPVHDDASVIARNLLKNASIEAYPFYQTVEYGNDLSDSEQAILEQQLYKMGILDALVVSQESYKRIQQEFPQLNDVIISEKENTGRDFSDLIPDTSMDISIQQTVKNILSQFSKENGNLILRKDGFFKHGILEGHALKEQSEYIGINARKKKKQRLLDEIQKQLDELKIKLSEKQKEIEDKYYLLEEMEREFDAVYDTKLLNQLIIDLQQLQLYINELARKKEQLEKETINAYNTFKLNEREMMKICSTLPYKRSVDEYDIIVSDIDDYKDIVHELLLRNSEKEASLEQISIKEDNKDQGLEEIDDLFKEKDSFSHKIDVLKEQIIELKNRMENPEIVEKTKRLQIARTKQNENNQEQIKIKEMLAVLKHDLEDADSVIEEKRIKKEQKEEYLKYVQQYFEEELNLHYVIDENDKSLKENARQAILLEEENNKSKTITDMTTNLYNAYQKNNSNLANYNTSIERVFEQEEEEITTRNRLIVTSIWIGKKLNLAAFIKELKNTIEIQEELIKEKDRELFEDILSQTISQKLTDKINESSSWVKEMSRLMRNMDTSMGLSFALDWKPRKPEEIDEMDVRELEKILIKDSTLVTEEEISKVSKHFRSIIQKEKQILEMNNEIPNYLDLVRNALDYRKWYEFKMSYIRVNEGKKDLTNAAFNRFSGGERAMAMYIPLFAAINAQYQKAKYANHPRMIALDEAFAGVDEKNISTMFEMIEKLDFDYIMNSQILWGCYETVKRLKISELLRPLNANYVTVINYIWNGKEKILNDR